MYFKWICFCLLLIQFACSACRNTDQAEGTPRFDFYTGREIAPIYSRSKVEKAHSTYRFPPALQGDIVKHDFIIRNDFEQPMELRKVEGCCGSVVESHTRVIPPGGTGTISVLLLTDSRGGQEINGTIRAETAERNHSDIRIDISMMVKEFAALQPYRVWLEGSSQEEIVETCTVIPNADYPFDITGIKARKGVWFDYTQRRIEANGRPAYEITIRNTRKKPGSYQDVLFVQTDNSARPEFKIRIEGRIH